VKAARRPKPHRQAVAYWLEHDGEVMLVRRPKRGMLGGMLALPTGNWAELAEPGEGAPAQAKWCEAGSVDHVFTHFSISVRLLCADAAERPPGAIWWPAERLDEAGLPTLFAKLASRGAAWRAAA
jgi:A/G-specific adenine glycosylase